MQGGATKVNKELQLMIDVMNEEWMKKEATWKKEKAKIDQAIVEKDQALAEKDQAIAEKDQENTGLSDAVIYLCAEGRGDESARAVNDREFRDSILRKCREAHGA